MEGDLAATGRDDEAARFDGDGRCADMGASRTRESSPKSSDARDESGESGESGGAMLVTSYGEQSGRRRGEVGMSSVL